MEVAAELGKWGQPGDSKTMATGLVGWWFGIRERDVNWDPGACTQEKEDAKG